MRAEFDRASRALLLVLVILAGALWPAGAAAEEDSAEGGSETAEGEGEGEGSEEAEGDAAEGGDSESDKAFDEIMRSNAPEAPPAEGDEKDAGTESAPAAADQEQGGTVEVPLAHYMDVARRLAARSAAGAREPGPRVVLGAASYEGEVTRGVLALRMKLHVTLSGEGFKVVPIAGDEVAIVSAAEGGEAIGLTRRSGYQVWVTDRRGAVTLEVSMLVAPRGPRGSSEYAFRSARTPGTTLEIRLPTEGLAPRFDGAVQSEIRPGRGGTTVRATLEPTTEIRLVGFRDLGREEGQSARIYAETSSLLSVDARSIELFTVARYHVLHAPAEAFEIALPEGFELISADGEGALQHAVERRGAVSVLRGEPAFPVQGSYELSLRLRRSGDQAKAGAMELPLPRCLGVEREHGWLAVEAPGKLRIAEAGRRELSAIDVRQLPGEVAASAVSPILGAYRYHGAAPALSLEIEQLPEREIAEGAIDRIDAVSVLSPEGKLLTELRITLRNTLRPTLSLSLPAGAAVRSARLDGEAVSPSVGQGGQILLPLKRSRGRGRGVEDRLEPFTLEVVLESARPPLGLLGAAELALPAADLTAAELRWEMHLPASNEYGGIRAAVSAQAFAGAASWHKPAHLERAVRWDEEDAGAAQAAAAAGEGRPELPRAGVKLEYARYWVAAGEGVRVEVPYARSWLLLPLKLLLATLAAAALAAALRARGGRAARIAWAALAAGMALALMRLDGAQFLGGAALAGIALRAEGSFQHARVARALWAHVAPLPGRARGWFKRQAWPRRRVARALALAGGTAVVGWMLVERMGRLGKALAECCIP